MSAIAKTSSITLLTGVPGNGKTLRAVWYISAAVKAGEQVFSSNLNGLQIPEVVDFPDPTKWEELPAGSILVVDEAQRFFRAAAGPVPAYIQAMETIRHMGIRLILITQSPALIHANIRALVGLHEHLVRENGKESATVYRRSRVIDNVRSDRALAVEDHETWAYPKECYALYKSAEVHTVKRTISSKVKRAIVLGSLAAALLGYVVWTVKSSASDDAPVLQAATGGAASGTGKEEADRWVTLTDYAEDHQPRFGTMPWTAKIYDGRQVTADPAIFCMSSNPGPDAQGVHLDHTCTCLTEQGTYYEMELHTCRHIARRGQPYNPYSQQSRASAQQQPPAQPVYSATAPSSAGSVVGYRPGQRADVFPLNPARTISSHTPATSTL